MRLTLTGGPASINVTLPARVQFLLSRYGNGTDVALVGVASPPAQCSGGSAYDASTGVMAGRNCSAGTYTVLMVGADSGVFAGAMPPSAQAVTVRGGPTGIRKRVVKWSVVAMLVGTALLVFLLLLLCCYCMCRRRSSQGTTPLPASPDRVVDVDRKRKGRVGVVVSEPSGPQPGDVLIPVHSGGGGGIGSGDHVTTEVVTREQHWRQRVVVDSEPVNDVVTSHHQLSHGNVVRVDVRDSSSDGDSTGAGVAVVAAAPAPAPSSHTVDGGHVGGLASGRPPRPPVLAPLVPLRVRYADDNGDSERDWGTTTAVLQGTTSLHIPSNEASLRSTASDDIVYHAAGRRVDVGSVGPDGAGVWPGDDGAEEVRPADAELTSFAVSELHTLRGQQRSSGSGGSVASSPRVRNTVAHAQQWLRRGDGDGDDGRHSDDELHAEFLPDGVVISPGSAVEGRWADSHTAAK
jgi:hypothetical protein